MMEDHFDTRQDYIKMGNELTRLANQQEREKKAEEERRREEEAKKTVTPFQANNASHGGGDGMPVSVPMKQSTGPSSQPESTPHSPTMPGANLGLRGFENARAAQPMNQNPFGGNRNF